MATLLRAYERLGTEKEKERELKKNEKGGAASLDISKLLGVESTKEMSDVGVREGSEV